MRALLGVTGLLLALAVVGVLLKKQLAPAQRGGSSLTPPALSGPAPTEQAVGTVPPLARSTQQQYQQAVEAAIQPPRPVSDDQ